MIIKTANFITSAVKPSQYPPPDLPEVAFAGRSNVGKSALINTLVNRKRLVKTSRTPGRTQLINFFLINDEITFVDLPGYGYAKVPAKIQKTWGPMIETYLSERPVLKGVVMIMDIRRRPGQEEHDLIRWLGVNRLPILPVLTKADKLSRTKQARQLQVISADLGVVKEALFLFSSKSRQGRKEVWQAIGVMSGLSAGEVQDA